jgi:hypothetical protein
MFLHKRYVGYCIAHGQEKTVLCTHHIWCRFMLHPGASRLYKLRHQFIFKARRSPSVEWTVRQILASLLCMFCVFMNCCKCGQSLISEFKGHMWWWVKSSRTIFLLFLKVQQYVCVCLSAWIGLRYMHFMGGRLFATLSRLIISCILFAYCNLGLAAQFTLRPLQIDEGQGCCPQHV